MKKIKTADIRVGDAMLRFPADKAILAGVIAGQQTATGKAGGLVRKWRTMRNEGGNSHAIEIAI